MVPSHLTASKASPDDHVALAVLGVGNVGPRFPAMARRLAACGSIVVQNRAKLVVGAMGAPAGA